LLGLLILSFKRFYRINKLLPVLFIFLILINTPNIIQTFYWQTGSLNYLAPFIFLNIFLGLIVFPPKKVKLFLPAVLLFIAGGFAEDYAVAQLVILFFIFIALKLINFSKKDERIKIVLSGMVGAVLSLGIMFLAPGNAVRALSVNHPDSLKFVIVSTFYSTKWYLERMLLIKPFIYSLVLLFTALLLLVKRISLKMRDLLLLEAISILTPVLVTTAVIGAGYYSMAIIPPERTLFIAVYIMLLCFVPFSFALISLIKPNPKIVWVIAILNLITSFFLIKSVISYWSGVYTEVKSYTTVWDSEEKNLLVEIKDGKSPTMKNISPVGGLDSFTDNGGWVASCLAGYFKPPSVKIQTSDDKIVK
jgi:hypothetical protein